VKRQRRKFRYTYTGHWGDLSPETVKQLEESDFIVDRWKGKYGEWTIVNMATCKTVGGFTGTLVGEVVDE
jgi:hypothetical protein